jgi:hypothetical protein
MSDYSSIEGCIRQSTNNPIKLNFCITYTFGKLPQKIEFENEQQFNEFLDSDNIKLLNKESVTNVVFHMGTSTFSLNELIGEY